MKKIKLSAVLITLILIIAVWMLITGIQHVPAGMVEVVMEVGMEGENVIITPSPLVNNGERGKLFLKQPKIPFLGIGYTKEKFEINMDLPFSTSFAFYTLDEITGKSEDRDRVNAYVIEGKISEVLDWGKFIKKLDLDKFNSIESPYSKKYEDRGQILAEQIKYLIRSSDPENLYPSATENRIEIQSPGAKIEYWFNELVSRRNFIVALDDRYHYKVKEDYISFLKESNPWYWTMGIRQFESLRNQGKEMAEFIQTPYSEDLTPEGYAARYINNEDYLLKINMTTKAEEFESSLIASNNNIKYLNEKFVELINEDNTKSGKMSVLLFEEYKDFLRILKTDFTNMTLEELNVDFLSYLENEVINKLVVELRRYKLDKTLESLAEYKSEYINKLNLNIQEMMSAERAVDYLKTNYSDYFESEDWEYFSTIFNREVSQIMAENPQFVIPDETVFQMIYFKILAYYLDLVNDRYSEKDVYSSKLIDAFYEEVIQMPEILNNDRVTMGGLIRDYYFSSDSKLLENTGILIGLDWNINKERKNIKDLNQFRNDILVPYFMSRKEPDKIIESEELWEAAITDVMGGENIGQYHTPAVFSLDHIRDDFGTPYSEEWWIQRELNINKKERIIKSFIYPWIDAHISEAFDQFITETDFVENLENTFGVRFSDLNMYVEERSIFSNQKINQVHPDYYELYYSNSR